MIYILVCVAGLLSTVVLVAAIVLFGETLVAFFANTSPRPLYGERKSLAIIVPAHNEATLIAGTLRSIAAQLTAVDRLVVVADNCTDETASIAAQARAEVISRTDDARRGKGYALDFAIQHLRSRPPDIVLVVDADCDVHAGAIDRLARTCETTGRPVQALYTMHAAPDAGFRMRMAEFAWAVKNKVRPTGLAALSLPCQLMGTGMAFPWQAISAVNLATGDIVEDMKLGIDLACRGTPPLFCPHALVTSHFPNSTQGLSSQRARWEHGHLAVILREAPRLLWAAARGRSGLLLALFLDLIVPPLALLGFLTIAAIAAGLALKSVTSVWYPLIAATTAAVLLAAAVMMAWSRYGRTIIPLSALLLAPLYALWKIPLYLRFVLARQMTWVRSKRDGDQ